MVSPLSSSSEPDGNSREESTESSATHSCSDSETPRERPRVHIASGEESFDDQSLRAVAAMEEGLILPPKQHPKQLPQPRINPIQQGDNIPTSAPQTTDSSASPDVINKSASASIPPNSTMKLPSTNLEIADVTEIRYDNKVAARPEKQEPRQSVEDVLLGTGSHSASASKGKSPATSSSGSPDSPSTSASARRPSPGQISLRNYPNRKNHVFEDDTDDDEEIGVQAKEPGPVSGPPTPTEEINHDDYVGRPRKYRRGLFSSILKQHKKEVKIRSFLNHFRGCEEEVSSSRKPDAATPHPSGTSTPKTWYKKFIHLRYRSNASYGRDLEDSDNVEDTINRQNYLLKLCRALMQYGAPTHRLEEWLGKSGRALKIQCSFMYLPESMMVSFDDGSTNTTELKLVKCSHGVDLSKLDDVYRIYKKVVRGSTWAKEATCLLDKIRYQNPEPNPWWLVIVSGLASAFVGPFAFGARLIDIPIAFILGSLVGAMQHIFAPKSELYTDIHEIVVVVLTSMLARAFGSINGGQTFCFSALLQSAIVLILPGYTVLRGSLELHSRYIVSGAVRMVYSIIHSIIFGYGITIGTLIYGALNAKATSEVSCRGTLPGWSSFIFVSAFTSCLIILCHGKWKDMPYMLGVALIGYFTNSYSAKKFPTNAQIANTLGALAIGLAAKFLSRFSRGLAVTTILPAILVQVPSGLAAGGSLLSGLTSANQITNQTLDGTTTVRNATQAGIAEVDVNTVVFSVGYSMILVSIGITAGLSLSALVVYPFGKKKSALCSF